MPKPIDRNFAGDGYGCSMDHFADCGTHQCHADHDAAPPCRQPFARSSRNHRRKAQPRRLWQYHNPRRARPDHARRAVSSRVVRSFASTLTRRSPVRRPCPRTRSIPALRSQSTWPESCQSLVNASRRARIAAALGLLVTASRAPAIDRAAFQTSSERNNALLGIHAHEHTRPTSSDSTMPSAASLLQCARQSFLPQALPR